MTGFTIRRFEAGDGEGIRQLNERAMATTPEWLPDVPDRDLENVSGHYLETGGEFLVGTVDGDVVATAAYEPLEGWMAEEFEENLDADGATVELSRMRVDPDHWGQGFGTRIYEELERRAAADGYDAFVLNTGVENDRARGFYESRGFAHVRNELVTFDDVTMHLALYRKSLMK